MFKNLFLKAISICGASAVIMSTVIVVLPASAEAPKLAPTEWFTDSFEHGNDVKASYNSVYDDNKEIMSFYIEKESEESENNVLRIKKSATISGSGSDVNVTLYPQQQNGSYAFVGEEDNDGNIAPKSGKSYRYIVEYKYKLVSSEGAYGIYTTVGVSEKDGMALKNGYTTYTLNDRQNTSSIGAWSVFNLNAPIDKWMTVSMPATYKAGDGFSKPVIAINFKIARAFKGELIIDDICIKRVAENDNTSTVILNPNDSQGEKYNPITYVTGAEYVLPIPTRTAYEFVGWYSDTLFSELCENTLPENSVDGSYTILYARWQDTTLTDDFNQKNSNNRILTKDFSVENGTGRNETNALKFASSGNAESLLIPIGLKGKRYETDVKQDQHCNYTAEIWYKADEITDGNDITVKFDLVDAKTFDSVASSGQNEITISKKYGNADGQWHKASVALRFIAGANTDATIAIKAVSYGNAKLLIDDLVIQERAKSFGSFKFNGDEYTGYYDPSAGLYGEKTNISVPDRNGYIFAGWIDAKGNTVNTASYGNEDYVLSPKWEALSTPEGTESIFSDDFDQDNETNRTPLGNRVIGPDTSEWATDNFERYSTEKFKTADYTNFDFSQDSNYSLTVDTEKNGNHYLHIVNKGGNNSAIRHPIWFRDKDGNIAGQYNQTNISGKYVVTYKFRYKVNSSTEGNYGLYMKTSIIRADTNSTEQVNVFALAKNKKPSDNGTYGEYYAIADGNWHTVSLSTEYKATLSGRKKDYYPGFVFDSDKRQVDICIDDMSIDVKYYNKDSGDKTALNFRFNTNYIDEDGKKVTGQQLDFVSANYGEKANLPTPILQGKVFDGWYYNGKPFDSDKVLIERTNGDGSITLNAAYRDPTEDDPLINTFNMSIAQKNGTGGTKALLVSSEAGGNGLVNLYGKNNQLFEKNVSNGEKINWIIRFRYRADTLPADGLSIDFDLSEKNSAKSLSTEKGTKLETVLSTTDGQWKTVLLPLSLTANIADGNANITLLIKLSATAAFDQAYFDEFEIFDAGESNVSFIKFEGKKYVAPIAGLVGKEITLPNTPDPDYSIGGWYKNEKLTELFGNAGEKVKLGTDPIMLYGEYLTPDGFYAVERFDRTTEIYEKQMTSRGSGYQSIWDQYGLFGKMRSFQITEETCHDADGNGKCLKYDIDGIKDTYSSILLTNNVDDQIYLGNQQDEEEALYLVSFWYKVDRADTNIKISVSGSNYNCMWENNSFGCDEVNIPVMYKTDGWQKMTLYLQLSWKMGTAGENAKDIYALFTVSGQGLLYFDDFEYTKVNTGRAESIYFDTDGTTFIAPYTGKEGDAIPELPILEKEGYKFEGWYTDYAYENKFDRTTFGSDGINYVLAYFTENEMPISDNTGDDTVTDDVINDTDETYDDISYERTPIYEDILEEHEVVNYRTKTVISKTKISGNSGLAWYWIVIIVVSAVTVIGGTATLIILAKRKKTKSILKER